MAFNVAPVGSLLKGNPLKKAPRIARDEAGEAGRDHLAFVRTLPCIVSGKSPVDAAHVSFTSKVAGKSDKGVGKKADDAYTLPLTHTIHMAQHAHPKGEVGFWKEHGLEKNDVTIICLRLWIASGDRAAALRVLADARSVMKDVA